MVSLESITEQEAMMLTMVLPTACDRLPVCKLDLGMS